MPIEQSKIDAALRWTTSGHEIVTVSMVEEHGVKKHCAVGPMRHGDIGKSCGLQNFIYDASCVRVISAQNKLPSKGMEAKSEP